MPEGHTLHHHFDKQHRWFAGQVLHTSSPQGPFAPGAKVMNGATLKRSEAWGKHGFWHLSNGAVLHVHLGLYGFFRYHKRPEPDPRGAVRLRVVGDQRCLDLVGPTKCELLTRDGFAAIRRRLGPDPIRDEDPAPALAKLRRSRRPIGATLLDQSIIAGIGNVYRAELLFCANLDPHTPSNEVPEPTLQSIWRNTVTLLKVGAKHNRILVVGEDTEGPIAGDQVDPRGFEVRGRYGPKPDRLWVYRRRVCKLCETRIVVSELGNRTLYRCPRCQPDHVP
jgi:endonuclease-8